MQANTLWRYKWYPNSPYTKMTTTILQHTAITTHLLCYFLHPKNRGLQTLKPQDLGKIHFKARVWVGFQIQFPKNIFWKQLLVYIYIYIYIYIITEETSRVKPLELFMGIQVSRCWSPYNNQHQVNSRYH